MIAPPNYERDNYGHSHSARHQRLGHFDYLAGVLFNDDFSILRGALVPHAVVKGRAKFVQRTNSYKFYLRDDVWDVPGVVDATFDLSKVTID